MENKKTNLNKGYVLVYDFGNIKLHNYNTADYIDDQVILLEKNKKVVVIESPAFFDNNVELEDYFKSLNVTVDGVLLSYHMGGGTFLKDATKLATHNADDYGHKGGGKAKIYGKYTTAYYYITLNNVTYKIKQYCADWDESENHTADDYINQFNKDIGW